MQYVLTLHNVCEHSLFHNELYHTQLKAVDHIIIVVRMYNIFLCYHVSLYRVYILLTTSLVINYNCLTTDCEFKCRIVFKFGG